MTRIAERRRLAQAALYKARHGIKLLKRNDPIATAFHEAAHAVFNEGFGQSVSWVTCYPLVENGKKLLGYSKAEDGVRITGPQMTMHALAGDIAEHPLIYGREFSFEGKISGTDGEELEKIWRASFAGLSDDEKIAHFKTATDAASQLVRKTMHWITPLAIELYVHTTLQGEQVRAILDEHGFYYAENPLARFSAQAVLARLFTIAEMGGLPLPPMGEDGSFATEDLEKWAAENGSVLEPLLHDKTAPWNRCRWDGEDEELSSEQLRQLAGSRLIERFGLPAIEIPATA